MGEEKKKATVSALAFFSGNPIATMPQSPANAILVQEGRPEPRDDISRSTRTEKPAPWLTRKRDLLFAFSIVSLPLLAITIIILVFVFEPDRHLHQIRSTDETNLPIPDQGFSKLYWTSHKSGPFLLLSSWASNIAAVVAAPFMMICSYVVAEEAIRNSSTDAREQEHVPHFFNEVLRGRAGMHPLSDTIANAAINLLLGPSIRELWRGM